MNRAPVLDRRRDSGDHLDSTPRASPRPRARSARSSRRPGRSRSGRSCSGTRGHRRERPRRGSQARYESSIVVRYRASCDGRRANSAQVDRKMVGELERDAPRHEEDVVLGGADLLPVELRDGRTSSASRELERSPRERNRRSGQRAQIADPVVVVGGDDGLDRRCGVANRDDIAHSRAPRLRRRSPARRTC